ncbi:hypothetical protein PsorP6_002654 [Peronosclerospora sorghi]|uniref:Uncharacterized protein n=1 Tax=Peronosclerospora sorghi TaxID=230839 RepID=A0ACC0WT18_9STRA|nr:hypothetical protein PsorP6_002654 [Peronosclerospora sorghi]
MAILANLEKSMRWYCVHPGLPLHAELRIRAAPDSSAVERAHIYRGRAIAACSPEFHLPASDNTTSWLQVAYLDVESGETERGYVMVALPNGFPLVTPWESTDFSGCCEVKDPSSLMYDGPEEVAQTLGAVQSVAFLYCMVEEIGQRVKIFHPELENVWVDKKDLLVVCTRLKHGECSTPHAFYELNEELPEEAQIAIRDFPSREAQAIGLLSRRETLEVTVRNENWLRISGGSFDKAWIMWRTDALQLLLEAPDVCSSNCESIKEDASDTVEVNCNLNQDFCADTDKVDLPSEEVIEKKPAPTINTSAPEATDKTNATSMVIDNEENSVGPTIQASENRSILPAPLGTVVIHNIAVDSAALHHSPTNGSCHASDVKPREENTEDMEHDHVAKYLEECMSVHDDIDDTTNTRINAEFKEPKVVDKQVTGSCYERSSSSARLMPNEAGGDGRNVDDHTTMNMIDIENKIKEVEDAEFTLTDSSQDCNSIQPADETIDIDNTIVKAISRTTPLEAKIIATDAAYYHDMEAMGVNASSMDSPMQPAQNVLVDNTWSDSSLDISHETKGADTKVNSLSMNDSLGPTVKISFKNDNTMIMAGSVVKDGVTVNAMQSLHSTETNKPSCLACTKPESTDSGSSYIKHVCRVSHVGECAGGEACGDRPVPLARIQNHDESVSNRVAYPENISSDVDTSAKEDSSAAVDHPRCESAKIVIEESDGSNVGNTTGFLTVVDAVSTKTLPNQHREISEAEDVKLSHIRQSRSDLPAQSLSKISDIAHDKILDACNSLSTPFTNNANNVVDGDGCAHGFSSMREAKTTMVEHAQSWSHQPIRPEKILHDVPQAASRTLQERPETCEILNDELEKEKKDKPLNPALTSLAFLEHKNGAAAAVESIASANNGTDDVVARMNHSFNVQTIGKDKAKDAEVRLQIESLHSALEEDDVCYSGASTPMVRGKRLPQAIASPSRFEKGYAEVETPSGSESGEIALLGGLEDMFEPVDELLPLAHEEDFWDSRLDATRMEIGKETIPERINPLGGDKSVSDEDFCLSAEEKITIEDNVQLPCISFLQEYGVSKLCEYKKGLIPPADALSQAIYEANEDDSDLLFDALVGDQPLSDDWFHDVSLRQPQGSTHRNLEAFELSAEGRSTFDLIMSDASPDEILAAELSDEDSGDFDLVSNFKYPMPRRRWLESSGLSFSFDCTPYATSGSGAPNKIEQNEAYHSPESRRSPSDNKSRITQEFAVEVDTPSKPVMSEQQSKMTIASSSLQKKSIATPKSISKPSGSFLRPRLQLTSPKSPAGELPSSLASSLETSTFSISAASASSVLTSSRPRRSSSFTPTYSRLQNESNLSRNSITGSSMPTEASALPAPRKSFGFRHRLSYSKKM